MEAPAGSRLCRCRSGFGSAPWSWVLLARAGAVAGAGLRGAAGAGGQRAAWQRWAVGGGQRLLAGRGRRSDRRLSVACRSRGTPRGCCFALALGGVLLALEGRSRWAVACFVGCALLRVEAWPFLVVLALWHGWRWRLVLACRAVLALWFVPEWLASGELLRSADRARVPNPGQPALADVPALASLGDALRAAVLAGGRRRRVAPWRPLGAAWASRWIALVARDGAGRLLRRVALRGAGCGGAGRRRRRRAGVAAAAGGRAGRAGAGGRGRARGRPGRRCASASSAARELAADLRRAVDDGGGARRLLRCGRPYVGRYRGPLLAYALARREAAGGRSSRAAAASSSGR